MNEHPIDNNLNFDTEVKIESPTKTVRVSSFWSSHRPITELIFKYVLYMMKETNGNSVHFDSNKKQKTKKDDHYGHTIFFF